MKILFVKKFKGWKTYYRYHASTGEMHFDLGETEEAKKYFKKALQLTSSLSEQQLLREKINHCNLKYD